MAEQVMTPAEQPSVEQEQSLVLSPEEVTQTLNNESIEPEVVLPSDQGFSMPDKFEGKSAEDIAKAYMELEKMKTQKPEEVPDVPAEEEGGDKASGLEDSIQQSIDKFLRGGELTEDEYTVIQTKNNITKEQVDEHLEYLKYKSDKENNKLLESVGGKELFDKAVAWAKETLTPEEIGEYNKALEEATPAIQKVIIQGLINQHSLAQKAPGEMTLHSNTSPAPKSKGYQSQHELLQDMQDPRYGQDRSYSKMVEQKMNVTDDSGWA